MKIFKLIRALVLSLALFGGLPEGIRAQENALVSEDDAYDSTFSGPLIYCRRADTALALADDAQTMPVLCDDSGKLRVTGGGGGAVTNVGTFAVQEDGAALTAQQAIQAAVEGTVTVNLGVNNDVTVTSGAITATLGAVDNAVLDTIDSVLDAIKIDTEAIETAVEGTLTVAGTVTADAGTNLNTSALALDANWVADDGALGKGVLLQGDDGTDRKNVNVDPSTGDVQVDVTNTVTVDLAGNNDVVATAGLLHANSPTTEATIVKVFNAGDIAATSMGASTSITIAGTGTLTKICVILTTGNIASAEDGDLIFFTTDPSISENTADLTVVKAKQISSIISLTGTDFTTDFATAQVNCQSVDEPYTALTHVLWHAKGATAYTNEIIDVLVTFRRDS